jgi:hypothetical protein
MAKHKKKHAKKDEMADDLLDTAVVSLKKFRKISKEFGKLSTGQKLLGGLALAAAGLAYLAVQDKSPAKATDDPDTGAFLLPETDDAASDSEAEAPEPSTRKSRKSSRGR